jgi:DNA-binding LacI/PurR family transcriptional regulator
MADGFLLMLPHEGLSGADLSLLCDGRPFVVVGGQVGPGIPSVVFDQRAGVRAAADYLLRLGHRRIAEIMGSPAHADARARHEAFVEVMDAHGLQPAASVEGDFQAASGYAAVQRMLATRVEFSALLVGNDRMALGAMRALREHGLRVPEDVSIVGFEDAQESAYYEPPLTTVRQNFDALGAQCVSVLVSLIEGSDVPIHQVVLRPELVVRQSAKMCAV